jgi:hypothetical protein
MKIIKALTCKVCILLEKALAMPVVYGQQE